MKQYPVEALDEYIRLQTVTNDHQIRAVLNFNGHLDLEKLRNAVKASFEMVPILRCRIVENGKQSSWVEQEYAIEAAVKVYEIGDQTLNLIDYLARIPNPDGPQVLVQVIRQTKNDTLILCLNHMAFDGSGFKDYLYLLSDLYSKPDDKLALQPKQIMERSLRALFKNIPINQRIGALFHSSFSGSQESLLNTDPQGLQPRVCLFDLPAEQFHCIKSICKLQQITINDFVLALFAKALDDVDAGKPIAAISIQTMFDLRRYVKTHPVSPFGNFSSMESLVINTHNQSFSQLAAEIHRQMERIKSHSPGLKNVLLIDALYRILPRNTFDKLLINTIKSIGVSTSNLGIIEDQRCSFAGTELVNAYMLTSIKHQPAIQLSFSTFRDRITFSFLGMFADQNWHIIQEVAAEMQAEIKRQCEQS